MSKLEIFDIHNLLKCVSEDYKRNILCQQLERLGAAGIVLFRVNTDYDRPEVTTIWDLDFSGELDKFTPGQVLDEVISHTPGWAIRWLAHRQKELWLQRYFHYMPLATKLILKLTSKENARPLADLLMISMINKHHYKLITGWHAPLDKARANHAIVLLNAYLRSIDFSELDSALHTFSVSETQLACFRWMAAGKSQQEIATILGMSYANVRYHMEKAKKDSGYATMQQVLVDISNRYDLSPLGPGR